MMRLVSIVAMALFAIVLVFRPDIGSSGIVAVQPGDKHVIPVHPITPQNTDGAVARFLRFMGADSGDSSNQ